MKERLVNLTVYTLTMVAVLCVSEYMTFRAGCVAAVIGGIASSIISDFIIARL